jgi:hypothetical protein
MAPVVSVSGIEKQSLNFSHSIINPLAFQSPSHEYQPTLIQEMSFSIKTPSKNQ